MSPCDYHPPEIRPGEGTAPQRSTAGAFLIRKGKVLLEKRPDHARVYPGLWDTPGGHVEEGESPEAALVREMKEELDITPARFFLGMVQDDIDPASGRFYRHFVYVILEWEGEVKSREGRTIQWFSMNEAAALDALNPLIQYALSDFRIKGWVKGE
jgi:8-oxo-dGTP diphosphatase